MSNSSESRYLRWERYLGRFFLMLISLSAIVLGFESFYRSTYKNFENKGQWDINDQNHIPRPYVMAVANPEYEVVNSLGYKGKLPVMPKPPEEKRIIIVGGSTVFGRVIDSEKGERVLSLPRYINEVLNKKFSDSYKVYNFGISSSVAQQSLARVAMDAVNFSPDLIISYEGANDFSQQGARIGYPHRFVFYEANPLWVKNIEDYPLWELIAYGSLFLRKRYPTFFQDVFIRETRKRTFYADQVPLYTNPVKNYRNSLEKMQKISKAFGAQFMGIFQPMKPYNYEDTHFYQEARLWRERILKELSQSDVNFFDLSMILKDFDRDVWEDRVHISPRGDQFIALEIAKLIHNELQVFSK